MAAGVPDLGALKHSENHEKVLAAMKANELRAGGFVCVCGEQITDRGVQLMGVWSGIIQLPSPPQGPGPQPQAATVSASFCSRECEKFTKALEAGTLVGMLQTMMGPQQVEVDVLTIRELALTTWLRPPT